MQDSTIRAYCNQYGYTDVYPFEVVRVVSPKCVEVRSMRATLAADWSPDWIPGGFAGHVRNNDSQRWTYESCADAPVIRVRLTKRGWTCKQARFVMSDKPRKFHDYNF
jgi:hypothetical protein